MNEEAMAHWGMSRQTNKQTNKQTNNDQQEKAHDNELTCNVELLHGDLINTKAPHSQLKICLV